MSTLLEAMVAEAEARTSEEVRIPNPQQPLQVLVCKPPTDGHMVERIQAAAKIADKGKAQGTNFCQALVAACVESIEWGGEVLTIDDQPTNFRDPDLQKQLGVPDAKSAVKKLIGSDGFVTQIALELLELAGYRNPSDPLDR